LANLSYSSILALRGLHPDTVKRIVDQYENYDNVTECVDDLISIAYKYSSKLPYYSVYLLYKCFWWYLHERSATVSKPKPKRVKKENYIIKDFGELEI